MSAELLSPELFPTGLLRSHRQGGGMSEAQGQSSYVESVERKEGLWKHLMAQIPTAEDTHSPAEQKSGPSTLQCPAQLEEWR